MDYVNRRIVVAVLILMAAGAYRVIVAKPAADPQSKVAGTLTRVIVGGYILALVASIIDLIGGPGSVIAGLLLALAVTTALYSVLPDLFQRLSARKA